MKLLNPEKYHLLIKLLSKVEINHHFALAVLEQTMDGSVYVDDLTAPTTFYIKHNYGMALLVGNTENSAFNNQLISYMLNAASKREKPEYMQVYPALWNQKLNELLPDKIVDASAIAIQNKIVTLGRINFRFNLQKYNSVTKTNCPKGKLVQTDAALFNKIYGAVVPLHFWRNGDEFTQLSKGFSALVNGEPVSTAYAAFLQKPYLELGIETKAEYHGKGYAHWVCAALINYCLENKLVPVWACRADNSGSIKLARKLGFEQIRTIPYYQLPCN
jgi:GNAT superfamily N-acetyltransferase